MSRTIELWYAAIHDGFYSQFRGQLRLAFFLLLHFLVDAMRVGTTIRRCGNIKAIRLSVDGYMPLSIEDIGQDAKGRRLIAISHTGEQNGDLMHDPGIVFAINDCTDFLAAEPISFRNDNIGLNQEAYRYDDNGKRTHVVPNLKRELKGFSRMWFSNLCAQGFYGPEVKRERLA